jgi:hypothetical protein
MLVPYNPEDSRPYYNKYYDDQVGHGMGVFEGDTIQTGRGIGSVVRSLFKTTLPLIKSGAKAAGKQLLKTGATIASEALQGRNFKESAADNFKEAGSNLLNSLASSLDNPSMRTKRKTNPGRKRGHKRDIFSHVKML